MSSSTSRRLLENISTTPNAELSNIRALQGEVSCEADVRIASTDEFIFLSKIPLELRYKVYSHLVISKNNDEFARVNHGAYSSIKLGLAPEILRTCKQIYAEASEILYAGNTFTVKCLDIGGIHRETYRLGPCTLDRHSIHGFEQLVPMPQEPPSAFHKIRHCIIDITPCDTDEEYVRAPTQVIGFCRIASGVTSLKSLVISTVCVECSDSGDERTFWWVSDRQACREARAKNLLVALRPFELFRNLTKFDIQCPECKSFKDTSSGDLCNLEMLVKSNEPVHHVFKCYDALLKYGKAFEGIPISPFDMTCERETATSLSLYSTRGVGTAPNVVNRDFFRKGHPLAETLLKAKMAADVNDYDDFKGHRASLLLYLEPQYARLASMSDQIAQLVKSLKENGGCLHGLEFDINLDAIHLEDGEKAICTRDAPDEIRISLCRYKRMIECFYNGPPREHYVQDLNDADNIQDPHKFRESFIKAVEDINNEWLEIRAAYCNFLKFDLDSKDAGCNIDLGLWREDKPLDFKQAVYSLV